MGVGGALGVMGVWIGLDGGLDVGSDERGG